MADPQHRPGLDFDSNDAHEQQLWEQLKDLPQAEPGARLRQGFYAQLEKINRPSLRQRLSERLGLNGSVGLLTASACLVIGLLIGAGSGYQDNRQRHFYALQQQVDQLQRHLVLDRLQSESASKRLRGVLEAVNYVEQDAEIANTLLTLATGDKVYTVRSAAIDALGPQLQTPAMGEKLVALLDSSQSPLVQFSLVELILRYGDRAQIDYLLQLNDMGRLTQEISDYVQSAVRRSDA